MNLSPLPIQKFFDNNGRPLVGGQLFTYAAGTTTKIATYQNQGGTPNTNPVILNYRGEAQVWLDAALTYKFVLARKNDTDPPANPIWTVDNIAGALTILDLTQQFLGLILYPRTQAEIDISVVPTSYWYPPGYVYRYGTNTVPGTTDMKNILNTCANVCRQGKYILQIPPEILLVTGSINFSGIRVEGVGDYQNSGAQIRASSAQFDVITCTGNSSFKNFCVHGGWDGVTAGLTGDCFSFVNPGGFAYVIDMQNINISFAKKRGIYWEAGGYGSLFRVLCYSSGLHGIELFGTTPVFVTTTIWIGGGSVFTTTPNGYGAKLTQCIEVALEGVTMESTKGIQINGGANRALSFNRVYQEFNVGSNFIDFGTSAGIGVSITNCIGIGFTITDPTNWSGVYLSGNAGLTECAIPFAGRIFENTGAETTTSTTGGVSVTAAQLSLGPGTYRVTGEFQTANSGGLPATMTLASRLTTNAADSGLANQTNANFVVGADTEGGAAQSNRSRTYQIFRLTATTTIYLRGFMDFSAGTAAYKGHLYAELIQ